MVPRMSGLSQAAVNNVCAQKDLSHKKCRKKKQQKRFCPLLGRCDASRAAQTKTLIYKYCLVSWLTYADGLLLHPAFAFVATSDALIRTNTTNNTIAFAETKTTFTSFTFTIFKIRLNYSEFFILESMWQTLLWVSVWMWLRWLAIQLFMWRNMLVVSSLHSFSRVYHVQ